MDFFFGEARFNEETRFFNFDASFSVAFSLSTSFWGSLAARAMVDNQPSCQIPL